MSEALSADTGRTTKVGGWEVDAKTLEVTWTEETCRIHEVPLGHKPPLEEAISFFHPDDRPELETAIQKALEHGEPFDMEIRFITAKGNHLWTHTTCKPIVVDGKTVKLTGTFQDITETKRAEEELDQSKERFQLVSETANSAICLVGIDGRFVMVNEQMCRMYGHTKEELESMTIKDITHPEDLGVGPRFIQRALSGEIDHQRLTKRYIHKDGHIIWGEVSSMIIRDGQGNPLYFISSVLDTTQRKKANEELRLHAAMMDNLAEGVYLVGLDDLLIKWTNERLTRMFGYDPGEMVGKHVDTVNAPTERTPAETRISIVDVLKETGEWHGEVKNIKRDGTHFWCYANVSLFDHPEYGKVMVSVHTDITQRKQMQSQIQMERDRLTAVFESMADGVYIVNEDHDIQYVNPVLQRDFGSPAGKKCHEYFHDSDEPCAFCKNEDVFAGKMVRWEWTSPKSGKTYDLIDTPVKNSDGTMSRLEICRDITERKQAEEELRKGETLLTETGRMAKVGGWEVDAKTLEVSWTEETCRIHEVPLGHKPLLEEAVDLSHPDDRHKLESAIQKALEHGEPFDMEIRLITAKGNHLWVHAICRPITVNGKTVRLTGTLQDITERKQSEAEREMLMSAIEQVAESILITDSEGTIQYVNPAFEQVTGYKREEAIGQTPRLLQGGEHDHAFYEEMWDTLLRGDTWTGRFVNKKKDGTLYTEEGVISPMRDASGRTVNYVAVTRDITEELKLEEQLRQAHKMESVGRLAGGVAHDFNNMLGVILGFAELAMGQVDPAEPLYADLEKIKKAAQHSADITRQLLAFARKQTVMPKVLDLNATVADMLKMLRRLIGEDIDLAWMPGAELWPVMIDPSQVDQVLANLCINARDAITGVGKVTIETGNVTFDDAYCVEHFECVPGAYVMLAVSDDGRGMDKEVLEHLFEPFFTTKGIAEASGLGLAAIYGIVKQNKGFIDTYSEPGKGTTFKIYLPRHEGQAVEDRKANAVEIPRSLRETVLLVEDEAAVLRLCQTILQRLGYNVLTAGTPNEALRLAEQHSGEIHLLMTDVIMPEMNGLDLAERLRSLYPKLKCLFMSGYTANVIARRGVLDEGLHFLQKPFALRDVSAKIREALDTE